MSSSDVGFQAALEEAKKGASEGGVPIGACLVSADGKILGRGHNMRKQKGSPTIHVSLTFVCYQFCSSAYCFVHFYNSIHFFSCPFNIIMI